MSPEGAFITLDAVNERIVQLVAHDGRLSTEEIAHAVGRSISTVRDRLAALEDRGIVLGYQARVDWAAAGLPYLAVFDADCRAEEADPMALRLRMIPGVVHAVVTTGRPNVFVMARAASVQGINRVRGHLAAAGLSSIGMRLAIKPLVQDRPPVESADGTPAADRP